MYKKALLFALFVVAITVQVNAQWSTHAFAFETEDRQYRVYVPPAYNPTDPAAVVITLHGLGGNMYNFSGIGMNLIADTANLIVVVPQALSDPIAGTAWNSGVISNGYIPNSVVNDVGFLDALIDTITATYTINSNRVYLCGFSMGGFMTERMACESNANITAFASVAGTIGNTLVACEPGRAIPIAHFHGTNDQVVPYFTNPFGINTDSLIQFWVANNVCDTEAIHTNLPDIANDGFTVEHFVYPNGQDNSTVELFKVNGADHIWLTTPENDISYTEEIWKFFNKHQILTSIADFQTDVQQKVMIYPNPARETLFIAVSDDAAVGHKNITARLWTSTGQLLQTISLQSTKTELDISNFTPGFYVIEIEKPNEVIIKKFIKK